jgi:hypothetical protein
MTPVQSWTLILSGLALEGLGALLASRLLRRRKDEARRWQKPVVVRVRLARIRRSA